ncbi:MAG: monovalent cation/H+ antiporter complex subunit F [Candidatus Aenigmarchaeota archaeon]
MIEYVVFLLVVAVFVIFVRLAKGPTLPDRVLAADTINSIIIGMVVLLGIYYNNQMIVDIAIVYAMIAFLGTLAVSKYLFGKEMHE